jgi:predicted lipoprotein with Yx(FWY)xxD motif
MHFGRKSILVIGILPVLALGLAACGGSSNSDSSTASQASSSGSSNGSNGGQTVATKSVSGAGNVLVDSSGKVLYTNDMDTASKVACTDQCLTEWVPLAAPAGGQPSSTDSAVQAKLGMLKRPDGSSQVTFGGLPLYTFVEDSPGQATGNGFRDSFGGTNFLWTAASVSGKSSGSGASTTSTSSSSGGAYGGSSGGGY